MTKEQSLRRERSEQQRTDITGAKGQPYDPEKLSASNGFLLLGRYRSALMGFAALWIYVFHEWQVVFDGHIKILWVENYVKKIGFCGVDMFLFLSGIGLTYSAGKSKNLLSFYYRRVKRIILPFVLVAVLNYYSDGWSAEQFWQNVLCINFYRKTIYAFLWFVPAILTLYLFFPLYYHLFARSSGKIRFTLCAFIIWLICTLFVRDAMRYDLFGFTNRIPVFLIGILAGWLAQKGRPVFDRLTWKLLGLLFLLGLYLSYLTCYQGMYILVPESDCCIPSMLIAVSISFLLARFLFILSEKRCFVWFGKGLDRIFSFFGMFTLEMYCIQEWMGSKVLPEISGRYNNLVVNIILFSMITVTALAMHFIVRYFWIFLEQAVQKLRAVVTVQF